MIKYFVKNKKARKIALAVLTAVSASAILGSSFLLSTKMRRQFSVPAYEVKRVIDGDTFETKEGQYIRVGYTEAPEMELCGGPEAKQALEKMVLNKPVYLKVVYRDPYQRLVSLVYTREAFINEAMLREGYSYYERGSSGEIGEELGSATKKARKQKRGIFSEKCTQSVNLENSKCNIKGNVRDDRIYYLSSCGVYHNVFVQLYLGDRWFCSETEAIKAGFRKPDQCR